MYTFAVAALLALGLVKIVQIVETLIPSLSEHRTIVTVTLAIAATSAINYSIFGGFGVQLRNAGIEKIATGVVLVGLGTVWTTVLGYLGSNQAPTSKSSSQPHSIAA